MKRHALFTVSCFAMIYVAIGSQPATAQSRVQALVDEILANEAGTNPEERRVLSSESPTGVRPLRREREREQHLMLLERPPLPAWRTDDALSASESEVPRQLAPPPTDAERLQDAIGGVRFHAGEAVEAIWPWIARNVRWIIYGACVWSFWLRPLFGRRRRPS